MTCPVIKKVTCPNCGTEGDFIIYSTINVTLHPELQEKMGSGELFIWKCPKCGNKYFCNYPFLYHDMEKGIMQSLSVDVSEEGLKELGLSGIIELD